MADNTIPRQSFQPHDFLSSGPGPAELANLNRVVRHRRTWHVSGDRFNALVARVAALEKIVAGLQHSALTAVQQGSL